MLSKTLREEIVFRHSLLPGARTGTFTCPDCDSPEYVCNQDGSSHCLVCGYEQESLESRMDD